MINSIPLSIQNGCFKSENKSVYIFSGEIHYFRISEDLWDIHLDKAVEAGLNTVSTYVPWCIHEPQEGVFDLGSFSGFASKVRGKGLHLAARVGPVSNAELKYEGLPVWLTGSYPQAYLKGRELSNLPHDTLVAYNHPDFQELVSRWYARVLPVVRENLLANGGCISMIQLCNEIGMVHWLNKGADYNTYSEEKYRTFLRKRYESIDKLNREYAASYSSFEEIFQPKDINITDSGNLLPFFDWMDYYCSYYADYFEFLCGKAAEYGISVPLIANIPQFYDYDVRGRGIFSPMTSLMFRDFSRRVPEVIIGGAYQMRRLDYENFHDVYLTSDMVSMIMSPGVPAMCCELQFGIMRDKPRIYPSDVELNLKTSAASGLNALNGYMFSGGVNYNETGAMGSYHEWQAPVTSAGAERPHFGAVRQFGRIVKSFGDKLAATGKVNDTVLAFYSPYYATEFLSGSFIEALEAKRTALFFDGLGRAAILAGYSFSFKDIVRTAAADIADVPHMICLSFEMMDRETQNKLADYVLAGGKLLMYPQIPVKDLANRPCTDFAERTGIDIAGTETDKFVYMKGLEAMVAPPVQVFNESKDAQILAKTGTGAPCALKLSPGKGSVVAAGFGFTHIYNYHVVLADMLLNETGINRNVVTKPGSEIITTLRASDEYGFLFAANYNETPDSVWIEISVPGTGEKIRIPSSGDFFVAPRSAYVMPVNLELSENERILYITAEIEDYNFTEADINIRLRGAGPCEAVLVSDRQPADVKVNGIPAQWRCEDGRIHIRFKAENRGSSELTLTF